MHAAAMLLLQSQADIERAQRMLPAVFLMFAILGIVCMIIVIIPFWFICKKAGFSPWLSFLNIVPFGGIILWYVLAFADWKVVPLAPPAFAPPSPYPPQPPYPPQA